MCSPWNEKVDIIIAVLVILFIMNYNDNVLDSEGLKNDPKRYRKLSRKMFLFPDHSILLILKQNVQQEKNV